TRAGAVTSRFYGEAEDLLARYAWYLNNLHEERTWPVGSLKPNDLGLFDVHGNVSTWCQEEYKNYTQGQGEQPHEDKEDNLTINSERSSVFRGGSWLKQPENVRSAARDRYGPWMTWAHVGFRPAKTFEGASGWPILGAR